MDKGLNVLKALITGRAIVLIKNEDNKRLIDVMVGNRFTKVEAINSLASTLKAIAN